MQKKTSKCQFCSQRQRAPQEKVLKNASMYLFWDFKYLHLLNILFKIMEIYIKPSFIK